MRDIHEQCLAYGVEDDGYINYMKDANIARFHAMQLASGSGRTICGPPSRRW